MGALRNRTCIGKLVVTVGLVCFFRLVRNPETGKGLNAIEKALEKFLQRLYIITLHNVQRVKGVLKS